MGNTLCIYDGDAQTRQIACLVGSVLSMSAYASYTETWDWERYERIVFIMGPRQAMFSHFAVWQPALQHKKLAFLWNDFQNIYTERIAAAIEARLDRPLDVTAFVSSENWLDDTICAAQAIQAREKGQGNPDEAVLQAMETFLAGHARRPSCHRPRRGADVLRLERLPQGRPFPAPDLFILKRSCP